MVSPSRIWTLSTALQEHGRAGDDQSHCRDSSVYSGCLPVCFFWPGSGCEDVSQRALDGQDEQAGAGLLSSQRAFTVVKLSSGGRHPPVIVDSSTPSATTQSLGTLAVKG